MRSGRGGLASTEHNAAYQSQRRTVSLPPVNQRKRIAELLDTLVMGGVASDKLQAMRQGNGRNHRIGQSDRLAGAFQVAPNATRKLGGGLAEFHDILGADMGEKGGDLLRVAGLAGSP